MCYRAIETKQGPSTHAATTTAPYLLLPSRRPSPSADPDRSVDDGENESPAAVRVRARLDRESSDATLLFNTTLGFLEVSSSKPCPDRIQHYYSCSSSMHVPLYQRATAPLPFFWHSVFGLEWVPMRCELIEDRCSSIVRAITRVYTVLRVVIITRETVGTGRLPLGDR